MKKTIVILLNCSIVVWLLFTAGPVWAACPSGNLACGKTVTGTAAMAQYPFSQVVDGNYVSMWNSGNFPYNWTLGVDPYQQVIIDLGSEMTINAVKLLPAHAVETGLSKTILYFTGQGENWGVATTFTVENQNVKDSQWLTADVDTRTNVRYIGVNTYTNPDWVAWREIEVYGPNVLEDRPTHLKPDWRTNGSLVNTPYPLLSWDLPQSLLNQIDTVVVRVRKDNDMLGCKADTIVEHWFTTSSSPAPCNIPATYVNNFSTGQPPNSFVVTPKNNLENNQTYYWSVYIHLLNGSWVGSDGFSGNTAISKDYFQTQFSPFNRNIFGVNVYTNSQFKERGILGNEVATNNLLATHLNWARLVSGVNGFVKLFFYGISNNTQSANPEWKTMVQMAYDRQLIPIIRVQGPWIKISQLPWGGSWSAPISDSDGNYSQIAQAYKRIVADLPKKDNTPIFIEFYNELNLPDGNWSGATDPTVVPVPFAKFFVAAYDAIHELNDPRVKVIIGGFAPGNNNLTSLNKMLEVPGFKERIIKDGYWTNHDYPSQWFDFNNPTTYQTNIPPGISANDGPFVYKYELDQLARAGIDVSGVKVIFSEGGWCLNTVSEDQMSNNTKTLMDVYSKDNYWIEAVTPFTLDGFADADVLDLTNDKYNPRNTISDAGICSWVYYDSTDQNGRPSQPHKVFTDVANYINSTPFAIPPASLPGDLNHDGHVDILDLRQLVAGFTNIFDYNLVIGNYGK